MSETRRKLFNLFRDYKEASIGEGDEAVTVGLRSLDVVDNESITAQFDAWSKSATALVDTPDRRAQILDQLSGLTKSKHVDLVIKLEMPTAEANVDLAPGDEELLDGEDEEARDDRLEKAAMERWESERRAELDAMSVEALADLFVTRQIRSMVRIRTIQSMIDASLVLMVVDPETKRPMFTDVAADPKTKAPNENFIGFLSPKTKALLADARADFMRAMGEKEIRKASEAGPSSPSGASPSAPDGSHGETIETLSVSPDTSPASTQLVAG